MTTKDERQENIRKKVERCLEEVFTVDLLKMSRADQIRIVSQKIDNLDYGSVISIDPKLRAACKEALTDKAVELGLFIEG